MSNEMASGRGGMSSDRLTSATTAEPATAPRIRRVGAWFLHELHEILPPVIFFLVGFNLIVLTTNLILADYANALGNFMLAATAALVVGRRCWSLMRCPFCGATIARRCLSRSCSRRSITGSWSSSLACSKPWSNSSCTAIRWASSCHTWLRPLAGIASRRSRLDLGLISDLCDGVRT
jgi:hypothetical protein